MEDQGHLVKQAGKIFLLWPLTGSLRKSYLEVGSSGLVHSMEATDLSVEKK